METNICNTTDQLKDLFVVATLNLEALDLLARGKPRYFSGLLHSISERFNDCEDLRLQKLIKDQIFMEGNMERRDRMKDYEDRVQLQRRMVSDKQTNYNNLFKKKNLKSLYYSPEDYAMLVANRKKEERATNSMHYRDFIQTTQLLGIKCKEILEQLASKSRLFVDYRDRHPQIAERWEILLSSPEQYQAFMASQQIELVDQGQSPGLKYEIGTDSLTQEYLNRICKIKKQNKQLVRRLDAKKGYTSILNQQNLHLKTNMAGETPKPAPAEPNRGDEQNSHPTQCLLRNVTTLF